MADSKITALASIGTGTDPANDPLVIVDVSDILPGGMSLTGTTKKVTLNNLLACSPTATLASATITGDLTARTIGLTVNSSGVGIGTNNQASFIGNSPKKLVIGDGTQTPALTLYGGTANVSGIYYAKGTVGNQAYRGYFEYDHNIDALGFGIAASTAMTLNATGLGVGASPLGKFDVYNTGADTTTFIRSDTTRLGQIVFRDNADSANQGRVKYDHSTDTLSLYSGGNENVFLSSSGNVGIGVAGPSYRLQANVATGGDRNIFAAQVTGASNGFQVQWNNGTQKLRVNFSDLPTSSAGLPVGTLWIDTTAGNTLKVA